jgi:outer membrane usher protein
VAPNSGAVVLVSIDTQVATTRLVTAVLTDGTPLPFGAEVVDGMGRSVGVVGQAGRVFVRAEGTTGGWTVRWSEGAARQCQLRLHESPKSAAGDTRHTGICE